MERLEKKTINGHDYYYYSKWEWDPQKKAARRQWQKYLGKLEDIVAAVDGGPAPLYAQVFEFGLVEALFQESRRQQVVEIIDEVAPKRRQGLSVGEYISVAAVNRAIHPVSKRSMWEWFSNTTLLRHLERASEGALSSQRFWDHMKRLSPTGCRQAWRRIITGAVERENLAPKDICYDGTNFYTFISTFNQRCDLPRRGKNKQGRSNLRQVSYSLFCCRDTGLPLFYDVYQGNRNDCRQFAETIAAFTSFAQQTGLTDGTPSLTVIFDKGNNSADNIALLDDLQLTFVGSVKLNEHKDLAGISSQDERFTPATHPELSDIRLFATTKTVYGKERRLVVTWNQNLYNAQRQTLNTDIDKALTRLSERQQKLLDRAAGRITAGRCPTVASVNKYCREVLCRPHLKDLIEVEVQGTKGQVPRLSYGFNEDKFHQLCDTILGKKIIISNDFERSPENIVLAYHSQFVIENVFRDMKDRHSGSWWPMHHWTDDQIHVHALYCSIAVLLRTLIRHRLRRAGLELSMPRLLRELADIREVINVYPKRRRNKTPRQTTLTQLNDVQQQLMDLLELSASPE